MERMALSQTGHGSDKLQPAETRCNRVWSRRIMLKTGKYSFLKWLKTWVKICRIITVLQGCEVKMWRPSGLSSSVILSSAFSSLVLPSTWQGFPLHSWLYNLSLCLSLNHSHSLVCVCVCTLKDVCACVCMHTCLCACLSDSRVHVNLWYVKPFERIYEITAVTLLQSTRYIRSLLTH